MAFKVIGNELAEKLRREDPEQFQTLVRMHLSFVLDLNTDDCDYPGKTKFRPSKWVFGKKTKCLARGVMEGAPLTQEGICQAYQLIEYLSKESNICQEGLFRRTGQLKRQQELKTLLNSGVPVNLDEGLFSVHDCASVLKNFLAELPEPLLTDAHYPIYCQIAEFCGPLCSAADQSESTELRLLHSLQLLLLLLPTENRILLRDVLKLLNLTAGYESCNKMSAESLSMMFTPHLLCPRKLTPEAFHANSQAMSGIVAFMIHKGDRLFEIPPKLATDIKVYWAERERRNASGRKGTKDTRQGVCLSQLDESVCDGTAANTVFTFVDRERTAQENLSNPTETALAQLYAYIQSLPESSKKRRLIKQFNKENGQGTPLQSRQKNHHRSKSLGDSIKKHIFNKSLKRAKAPSDSKGFCTLRSLSQDELNSPLTPASKSKFFRSRVEGEEYSSKVLNPISNMPTLKQSLCDSNSAVVRLRHSRCSSRGSLTNRLIMSPSENSTCEEDTFSIRRAFLHNLESQVSRNRSPGSPYHLINRSSPLHVEGKKNCSLIKGPSEGHHPQENILRPSSEVKGFETPSSKHRLITDSPAKNDSSLSLAPHISLHVPRNQDTEIASVSNTPVSRLPPCKLFTDSPVVLSGASSACNLSTTNRLTTPQKDQISCLITSTPASQHFVRKSNGVVGPYDVKQTSLNHSFLTPDENNSMSPITRSTQRMSKAMQETMMTPRSRKPVVVLSGSNICHLANVSAWQKHASNMLGGGRESTDSTIQESPDPLPQENASCNEPLSLSNQQQMPSSIEKSSSLTCPFKSYLLSRSVVTASPVDLSFTSRTGDFDTSLSHENCLSAEPMSESLLYCLEGHGPPCSSDCEESNLSDKDFNEQAKSGDCNNDTVATEALDLGDFEAKILNFPSPQGPVRETSL